MAPKDTKVAKRKAPKAAFARLLLAELRELILQARAGVARAVDSGLARLYWRACDGGQIFSALRRQLPSIHYISLIYLDDSLKWGTVRRRMPETPT